MIILVSDMEPSDRKLNIFENKSNIFDLWLLIKEPCFEKICGGKVPQLFQILNILINVSLLMHSISFDFHLMLENIKSICGIITMIKYIFLRFFNVALIIAPKISAWPQHQVDVIYFKLQGTSPEIEDAERNTDIGDEASFHLYWDSERIY